MFLLGERDDSYEMFSKTCVSVLVPVGYKKQKILKRTFFNFVGSGDWKGLHPYQGGLHFLDELHNFKAPQNKIPP